MPLPPTIIQTLLPNVCTPFTLEVKLWSLALTLRALAQLVAGVPIGNTDPRKSHTTVK